MTILIAVAQVWKNSKFTIERNHGTTPGTVVFRLSGPFTVRDMHGDFFSGSNQKCHCAKPLHRADNGDVLQRGYTMSRVTIKTGFMDADGREEELIEYLCDYPNCPNIATNVVGCRELRQMAAVCEVHTSSTARV